MRTSQNSVKAKFDFPVHDFYVLGCIEATRSRAGPGGSSKSDSGKGEKEPLGR
jgi:hypothetical protein